MTVLFCTVFYYGVAIQSSAINVPPFSIVKMRETSRLFILILAYEGGVGHVYSQSRGRGQRKIFWDGAPDPNIFCPPPNKNSWRRHGESTAKTAAIELKQFFNYKSIAYRKQDEYMNIYTVRWGLQQLNCFTPT